MGAQFVWSILLLAQHVASQCPCMVDHTGVLTCESNTINQFPEDLKIEECNIHTGNVRDISLSRQTFTEVKNMSFADFPNLEIINLAYNEIEAIRSGAFASVPEVREINLRRNNIKIIERGVFDDVVKLSNLDVRDNSPLERYETSAWHFCERTKHDMSIEGNLEIFKNLQQSHSTQDYCNYVQNVDAIPLCAMTENSTQLDCTGQRNLGELACHIQDLHFGTILFDFPADYKPPFVENYFEGESNGFIMDFNSISGSENHTRMMEKLSLFNTKFDLSTLPTLTSNRTKEVILKADTVFITEPVTIDYRLTIHARVVALNTSVHMSMSKNRFLYNNDGNLESWAFKEETVSVGKVIMRTRKFGLIEIVDQLPEDASPSAPNDYCKPVFINSTETSTNLTSWFDSTFINLNYVCARTVQSGGTNLRLATDMANFTLNFALNSEDVQDRETYMAAQKFKRIMQAAESPNIHNVPSYSINTVSELAGVMVDRMSQYRANEIAQEEQLFIATGRIQDMQIQFDIIMQQQQMYFDMEQTILDAIWAATDNSWDFSFDHRNSIEDTIMGAMNASAEAAFEMQEQQYKELLAKAEANLEHMEDVVEKYQSKLDRTRETAKAALDVQHTLSGQLQPTLDALDREITKIRREVQDYIDETAVGAWLDFLDCLIDSWFWDMWSCEIDVDPDLGDISTVLDTIIRKVNAVVDLIEGIDIAMLDTLSDDMPTGFKSALHAATELVKNGPTFDQLKNVAENRMPGFSHACDDKVDVGGMMEAMANVADTGHALTESTSKFSDTVLELANTKDELRVAQNDVQRSIEEVQRIKEMLDELEQHREDYQDYMEEAQRKYEEEVERMKEEYHDMSDEMREEFKANITASFQNYQQIFLQQRAQYNVRLSQLITSITDKSYGLKTHSMNQRGMIMSLYMDFCDAYFYHSFSICEEDDIPLMSDSFELLLEKLSNIKWDSVTSNADLPGVPIDFGPNWIMIEDQPDLYKYPVSSLRNTSRIDFNLRDYDTENALDRFWRVRLSMLRITLLDETETPIPSPGQGFGQEIQSLITFPTVFNDTFLDHEAHTFLCQNFFCTADYVTNEGDVTFKSSCEVNEEFSDQNYKPSPDGIYSIWLPNAEKLAMSDVTKVKVEFGGSYIPYPH